MIPFEEVMSVTKHISGSAALEDPEAKALYDCCVQVPEGGCVVEVGCQLGRSSSIILQVGKHAKYHSIHIDPYTEQPEYLKGWVEMMYRVGGAWEHAWTLLCMRTEQAAWHLSKLGLIDMAFIDGDHEKDSVTIDLKLVADRIKPEGLLACHDYANQGLPGVIAAVQPYVAYKFWDEVGVFGSLGVWRRK
jgi:predicted O-methyltransferase YrrM